MPELKRLNWEVLPPGEYPWEKVKSKADPIINQQPNKVQTVIRKRLNIINKLNPDFYAVGRGGFSGYLIFGFSDKGLYVLESTKKNNATYIFGEDWKTLSKMTKAEILSEDKQETRIIHRNFYSWSNKVKNLLED